MAWKSLDLLARYDSCFTSKMPFSAQKLFDAQTDLFDPSEFFDSKVWEERSNLSLSLSSLEKVNQKMPKPEQK